MLLFFIMLCACSQPTAEAQIREQLAAMVMAIESQHLGDFMEYIHPTFKGNNQLNRGRLRALLFFHLQRNRSISVYQWDAEIAVSGDRATVQVKTVVTGSNKLLPERGRIYKIESNWIMSEGQWMIVNASWTTPQTINLRELLL